MKNFILTICIAAIQLSVSSEIKASEQDLAIPYTKHVLDNGLILLIHQDKKAPIVSVNVWYHVGSKDEKVGRTGFAHLFEHLMFNGSNQLCIAKLIILV
jgi:zinc protease